MDIEARLKVGNNVSSTIYNEKYAIKLLQPNKQLFSPKLMTEAAR